MFEDDFTRIMQNYTDAVPDKKRFIGLLKDFFPEQQMQVNLLRTVYDLDIVKELDGAANINNAFAFRFVKRMVDEYGISRLNADWAVSVWCVCYGQRILHKPCEIKISQAKRGAAPAIREERNSGGGRQYGDLFRYAPVSGGYGVTGFIGDDKRTIIFSNRYNGQPVRRICAHSFCECEVQQAVMTDGMEVIEDSAFAGCGDLKQVIFPTTLKEIGDSVFSGCTELVTAALPEGLEQIGRFAFQGCALRNIGIPKSVYWLGEGAFAGCERVEKITVPDNIIAVPDRLFQGCKALKAIQLPETLGSIGASAFEGCERLETLIIPESVRDIGEDAFSGTAKKFTLLCKRGSAAEQYARERDITFQIIF